MIFNMHSDLEGKHAFLSPSNYHWINYNDQKLEARYIASSAAKRGSDLHELAHDAIRLRVKLPKSSKTLHMYVNDAIYYKMDTEVCLYYSANCFGHADTLSFHNNFLRIHDLKTGLIYASEHQLEIYAALFCLEYNISPFDIRIELRIYQNNDVRVYRPYPEDIWAIMDKIILFDQQIEIFKESGEW